MRLFRGSLSHLWKGRSLSDSSPHCPSPQWPPPGPAWPGGPCPTPLALSTHAALRPAQGPGDVEPWCRVALTHRGSPDAPLSRRPAQVSASEWLPRLEGGHSRPLGGPRLPAPAARAPAGPRCWFAGWMPETPAETQAHAAPACPGRRELGCARPHPLPFQELPLGSLLTCPRPGAPSLRSLVSKDRSHLESSAQP